MTEEKKTRNVSSHRHNKYVYCMKCLNYYWFFSFTLAYSCWFCCMRDIKWANLKSKMIHTVHSYEISVNDRIIPWFVGGGAVNEIGRYIVSHCLWCCHRLRITVRTSVIINFVRIVAAIPKKGENSEERKKHSIRIASTTGGKLLRLGKLQTE